VEEAERGFTQLMGTMFNLLIIDLHRKTPLKAS